MARNILIEKCTPNIFLNSLFFDVEKTSFETISSLSFNYNETVICYILNGNCLLSYYQNAKKCYVDNTYIWEPLQKTFNLSWKTSEEIIKKTIGKLLKIEKFNVYKLISH